MITTQAKATIVITHYKGSEVIMNEPRKEIEELMRKLTREQLKEFIAYLQVLEASAGQH